MTDYKCIHFVIIKTAQSSKFDGKVNQENRLFTLSYLSCDTLCDITEIRHLVQYVHLMHRNKIISCCILDEK